MKKHITILLTLAASFAFAQTDSVEMKLTQYKKWFDSGLIDKEDYEIMKQKALKRELSDVEIETIKKEVQQAEDKKRVVEESVRKVDTMELAVLKERFTLKIIAGTIFMGAGVGMQTGVIASPQMSLANKATLLTFGVASTVTGIVLAVLGGKERKVFLTRSGKEITLLPSNRNAGVALLF
jgi:hypothetical protein